MINVANRCMCCGCSACANICPHKCIKMEYDSEGFLYPRVYLDKCVDCHACERVCPYLEGICKSKNESINMAIQSSDDDIRKTSTAGGAFSLIADALIAEGAIVYAVGYNSDMLVCHQCARSEDEIVGLRGSKYVQSDIGSCFDNIRNDLRRKQKVLFVGTPCQTHGLINCVGENPNLYVIDLLCLGVTSPKLFNEYINYLNDKYKLKVKKIYFRSKKYGYATPNIEIEFENGKHIDRVYDSRVHANLFFKNYYNVRPSCYECVFREKARVSDFTIGDFVEIGEYSNIMDDDRGTTKIWIHTDKGKRLINKICICNRHLVINENCSNVIGGASKQIKRPVKREEFFVDSQKLTYKELVKKWEPKSIKGEIISFIRPVLYKFPFGRRLLSKLRMRRRKKYLSHVGKLNDSM